MSDNSQATILRAFEQASGNGYSGTTAGALASGLASTAQEGLTDALVQASQVINAQTSATSANTDALTIAAQSRSTGSGVSEVTNAVSTAGQFLGGGLSLMPLFSLFSGLFGGGKDQQPAPLVPYSLPPSLNLEATTNNQNVVWGENALPRAASGAASSLSSQITVQVQAIDSQSFLDHSDEIAQAVRQAMLNMNPLNDVVANL